jgi:hypothetical protein
MKPFDAIPAKDAFDVLVEPGDSILIMTVCRHVPNLRKGTFLGVRKNPNYWNKDRVSYVVQFKESVIGVWNEKPDGSFVQNYSRLGEIYKETKDWGKAYEQVRKEYTTREVIRHSSLILNKIVKL